MIKELASVQNGILNYKQFKSAISKRKLLDLRLNESKNFKELFQCAVSDLDIDSSVGKFLLCGYINGCIAIHDVSLTEKPKHTCKVIAVVNNRHSEVHDFSVDCVQWYPYDVGIFTTSGADQTLKIWDTDSMHCAEFYRFQERIYQHNISQVISKAFLIAVTNSKEVSILDVRSGSRTNLLVGHSDTVLSCKWSPTTENIIATGGCDSKILIWDIRSSKSFLKALDQSSSLYAWMHNCKAPVLNFVNGIQFSQDGFELFAYSLHGAVRQWNLFDGSYNEIRSAMTCNCKSRSIKFSVVSYDNNSFVYIPNETNIFLYDAQTKDRLKILRGHCSYVSGCVFNHFDHELYSGGLDRNIIAWTPEEIVKEEKPLTKSNKKESKQLNVLEEHTDLHDDAWSSEDD